MARGVALPPPAHQTNYWTALLADDASASLPDSISVALDRLAPHKAYLRRLTASGGKAELFVGWFFEVRNSGDDFSPALMARLSEFGLTLSLDIYASAQKADD